MELVIASIFTKKSAKFQIALVAITFHLFVFYDQVLRTFRSSLVRLGRLEASRWDHHLNVLSSGRLHVEII